LKHVEPALIVEPGSDLPSSEKASAQVNKRWTEETIQQVNNLRCSDLYGPATQHDFLENLGLFFLGI
jgi:hypothetical protein